MLTALRLRLSLAAARREPKPIPTNACHQFMMRSMHPASSWYSRALRARCKLPAFVSHHHVSALPGSGVAGTHLHLQATWTPDGRSNSAGWMQTTKMQWIDPPRRRAAHCGVVR